MSFTVVNPTSGEAIERFDTLAAADIDATIAATHEAFLHWRRTPISDRTARLRDLGRLLRESSEDLARRMAVEMGKPLRDGRGEVAKCAAGCDWFAENAERLLEPEPIEVDEARSFVTFEPLGVILAVMPWNFPIWQVIRFAAPATAAGNAVLLKHAPNVPGCAASIEELFRRAGFPRHLFRNLFIEVDDVERVLENRSVVAATLTGSTRAGRSVAALAGKNLKKSVLELGGSDPYVVLEDADVEQAAAACAASRLQNAGQTCIAAKRMIVVESVADAFETALVRAMREAKCGDPLDESTTMGPLARADLRDNLERQVRESVDAGARCLLGGEALEGPGSFYPPTVLTDVRAGMPAFDEEVFGPVAAVVRVADEAEAIRAANDSEFGLGAAVFTRDVERGERIAAHDLEAGCCFVNDFVRSDPRMPFGGIKSSGYGRELAAQGIREFTNVKTVLVKTVE